MALNRAKCPPYVVILIGTHRPSLASLCQRRLTSVSFVPARSKFSIESHRSGSPLGSRFGANRIFSITPNASAKLPIMAACPAAFAFFLLFPGSARARARSVRDSESERSLAPSFLFTCSRERTTSDRSSAQRPSCVYVTMPRSRSCQSAWRHAAVTRRRMRRCNVRPRVRRMSRRVSSGAMRQLSLSRSERRERPRVDRERSRHTESRNP